MRTPLIAANWKMNLGRIEEALALVRRLRPALSELTGVDVAICPPFPVLPTLAEVLHNSGLWLGAQTMHWEDAGARTGDVSPLMLRDLCDCVILGHSERRAAHGADASDESVNRKALAALRHGLVPIICVGEDSDQRDAGQTHDVVGTQVRRSLARVEAAAADRLVYAYEPVWAIGSGRAATPAAANRTIALTVRGAVAECLGESAADRVRILYGGSVSVENVGSFLRMPDIDGALVGGAGLTPGFADLVRAAVSEA